MTTDSDWQINDATGRRTMSIDTSKIEVGDWVKQGDTWSRVVEVESYDHNGFFSLKTEADCSGDITAHRPKSGPFKVGDEVLFDGDNHTVSRVSTVHGGVELKGVYENTVNSWINRNAVTLHRPVEAIEAERKQEFFEAKQNHEDAQSRLAAHLRDLLNDIYELDDDVRKSLLSRAEQQGYRIERIEQPVTLADLPKIGHVDDAGIEWGRIGTDEVWHGGDITYYAMKPGEILVYLKTMSRQLIAEGKLDDAVKERAEVIS